MAELKEGEVEGGGTCARFAVNEGGAIRRPSDASKEGTKFSRRSESALFFALDQPMPREVASVGDVTGARTVPAFALSVVLVGIAGIEKERSRCGVEGRKFLPKTRRFGGRRREAKIAGSGGERRAFRDPVALGLPLLKAAIKDASREIGLGLQDPPKSEGIGTSIGIKDKDAICLDAAQAEGGLKCGGIFGKPRKREIGGVLAAFERTSRRDVSALEAVERADIEEDEAGAAESFGEFADTDEGFGTTEALGASLRAKGSKGEGGFFRRFGVGRRRERNRGLRLRRRGFFAEHRRRRACGRRRCNAVEIAQSDQGRTREASEELGGLREPRLQGPGFLFEEPFREIFDPVKADLRRRLIRHLGSPEDPVPQAEDDPKVDRRFFVAVVVMVPKVHPRAVQDVATPTVVEAEIGVVEVADQGSKDRVDEDRHRIEAEEGQGKVADEPIDDDLRPLEAKGDDPIHLAVHNAVMAFVELPEPRDTVEEVVNAPLDEVDHEESDEDLHRQRPSRSGIPIDVGRPAKVGEEAIHRGEKIACRKTVEDQT